MLKQFLNGLVMRIKGALGRFPETLFLSGLSGAILIYLIHLDYSIDVQGQREFLERVLMSLAIGILSTASLQLVTERWLHKAYWRILSNGLILAVMLLFYFIIPDPVPNLFAWRYAVTLISLAIAFSLVPFWGKERLYPVGTLKLISDGAITFLYSLVLYLGGAAILFALDELLGVPVNGDWYGDYAVIIGAFFAPTHYLGSLVKSSDDMLDFSYSRVFKILLVNIVMPLLLIYTGILYLYFLRLPFVGGIPKGEVANLVMWYSVISLSTFFLSSPLRDENKFAKAFLKWMPMAMLVPLAMMFVAIWIRIDAYGITVKRYFVVALGLWILVNTLYRIFCAWTKREILDSALVLTAISVMLLSLYGPWSAYPISLWNQNQRFESTLAALQMWDGNKIVPRGDLTEKDEQKISSALMYFNDQHQLSDLNVLPADFDLSRDMVATFGFEYHGYIYDRDQRVYFNINTETREFNFDVKENGQLYRIDWFEGEMPTYTERREASGISISNTGLITVSQSGNKVQQIPLNDILNEHLEKLSLENKDSANLSADNAVISHTLNGGHITFFIESISGYQEENQEKKYDRIQLIMILD